MSPIMTVRISDQYLVELKHRLDKEGITQAELSAASGISPQQLSRWFNNPEMIPTVKNIMRLEQAVADIIVEKRKAKRKKAK